MEPIPVSDIFIILVFGAVVLFSAYFFEKLAVLGKLELVLSRKILHIIGIGSCAIVSGVIQNHLFLIMLIALAEIPIFYFVVYKDYFTTNDKKSWGIVYFPIVFIGLLWLFPNDRFLVIAPMGLLALADAAATIFGENFARSFFNLTGDRKSIIGSITFVIVSFIWFIILGIFGYGQGQSWAEYLTMAITVSVSAGAAEALGSKGRDNIWVPVSTAFLLWSIFRAPVPVNTYLLTFAVTTLSSGAYVVYRLKLLTASGAVSAALLGVSIWILGGFSLFPILLFFATGSLLGKLRGKAASDLKSNEPRDSTQVFSNGGVALILAYVNCIWPNPKLELLYLISCAVACSDTWGSEIGSRFGVNTYDILRWKKIPKGVSGGVSPVGFVATFVGAIIIACFASSIDLFYKILLLGSLGSIVDSILGAALQARYVDENGGMTDMPTRHRISGYRFITNDVVNIFSIFITVVLAAFIL